MSSQIFGAFELWKDETWILGEENIQLGCRLKEIFLHKAFLASLLGLWTRVTIVDPLYLGAGETYLQTNWNASLNSASEKNK